MKSLTIPARNFKSRRSGISPINLLEIEFGGVIGTKYYSDRIITVGTNTYSPLVKDWGSIDFILTNSSSSTTDLRIVLVNSSSSPLSDIFIVTPPEGKIAKIYQFFEEANEVDKTLIFNGRITSPVSYSLETVEIDIVERILDLESKIGTILTKEVYPRSLESHRGRIIPNVLGFVRNVPAVCIYTSGKGSLTETITDVAIIIYVDNGYAFPTDSTWIMIIEDEQILMVANVGGGNTLTAITRGYNATTPTLHTKGTQFYEKLSTFKYQVFDNAFGCKAKSISNVRINKFLLDPSTYIIDQVLYPGQIVFSSYPQIDEEKETMFDDYDFDSVINDKSYPYAQYETALIGDNTSSFSLLNSGQRLILSRAGAFNNNNQYKRAYLYINYYTDKIEWANQVQIKAYWNNILLGQLPDPLFDPEVKNDTDLEDSGSNHVNTPFNQDDSDLYQRNDQQSTPVTVSETMEADASNLSFETPLLPDGTRAPISFAWWNVSSESDQNGVLAKFDVFCYRVDAGYAKNYESNIDYSKEIKVIFNNFRINISTGSGETVKITKIVAKAKRNYIVYDRNNVIRPDATIASTTIFTVKKRGTHGYERFSAPLYLSDIEDIKAIFSVRTDRDPRSDVNISMPYYFVSLSGSLGECYLEVWYDRITEPKKEIVPSKARDPRITIQMPIRKSKEVEKVFEITDYVTDWAELLNKGAEIRFESEGTKIGTNLFVSNMSLKVESGNYEFSYSDEITADVEGYYVDGAIISTDYGELGSLINRPDLLFKLFLTWNSLFILSDLSLTSYNEAASFYIAQQYRLDFAIIEEITLREVLERMAFQVRTDQYWETGIHKIKVLLVPEVPIKQLTTYDIQNASIERSDIKELVNLLEIRYNIDYSFINEYTTEANRYRSIISRENTDSQTIYGIRKSLDATFYFDFVTDDVTASHVANYYLSVNSSIKKILTLNCFLNQLELEKHDIVGVTFPLDGLAGTLAKIIGSKFLIGNADTIDKIELKTLLEDFAYSTLSLNSAVSFTDSFEAVLVALLSGIDSVIVTDTLNFIKQLNKLDGVKFIDTFISSITKHLSIHESSTGGWGTQKWGTSNWGTSPKSFEVVDILNINRIIDLTAIITRILDSFSIVDSLNILVYSFPTVAELDSFFSVINFTDNLSITII